MLVSDHTAQGSSSSVTPVGVRGGLAEDKSIFRLFGIIHLTTGNPGCFFTPGLCKYSAEISVCKYVD